MNALMYCINPQLRKRKKKLLWTDLMQKPLRAVVLSTGKWRKSFIFIEYRLLSIFIWPPFLSFSFPKSLWWRSALLLYCKYAAVCVHTLVLSFMDDNLIVNSNYICINKRFIQFNHLIFSFCNFPQSQAAFLLFFFPPSCMLYSPFPFKLIRRRS